MELKSESFRGLTVYKKAFALAMEIFEISKRFPKDERFGLTSQIRRSSRAVCSSIGEAYRKRQYPAHFSSKSSDGDSENTETMVWLDFALACSYIERKEWEDLERKAQEVGRLIGHMVDHPEAYARERRADRNVQRKRVVDSDSCNDGNE